MDIILNDKDSGRTTLVISDHLKWDDDNEKLLLLQEKINKYIAFLGSGEVYRSYPEIKHGNFTIELISKYRPNSEGDKFLTNAKNIIEGAGFSFIWSPLKGGYDNDHS